MIETEYTRWIQYNVSENKDTGTRIVHSEMKDGTHINLWIEKGKLPWIASYPKAIHSSFNCFGPKKGKSFCLCLTRYNNSQDVYNDFIRLQNGNATLIELSDRFHNGNKDKFYMGMDVDIKNIWDL